jgi:hypothetical protein
MNIRYLRYIRSCAQWQAKRQAVLERDSYRCQLWLDHPGEEVHHKTYAHMFDEPLEDLITLCHTCHHMITDAVRRERNKGRKLKTTEHQRIGVIVDIERKPTRLIPTDVLRRLPLPAERARQYGVSFPEIPARRNRPVDRA